MTLAAANASGAASYVNEKWVHGAFAWRYADKTALRRSEVFGSFAALKKMAPVKGPF
jgi:hypothetical protein